MDLRNGFPDFYKGSHKLVPPPETHHLDPIEESTSSCGIFVKKLTSRRRYSAESDDSAFDSDERKQDLSVEVPQFEDLSQSSDDSTGSVSKKRGILKHWHADRLRSYSESDCGVSSLDYSCIGFQSVEEEDENAEEHGEDSERVKKTVRFSDVVRQQLFRSNSSILGQRKKNQRKQKLKNKKKDAEKFSSSVESVESLASSMEELSFKGLSSHSTPGDSGVELEESDSDEASRASTEVKKNAWQKSNKSSKVKPKGRRRCFSDGDGAPDMLFDLEVS